MLVARQRLSAHVRSALDRRPVVVLAGARQCGKTTLARHVLDPSDPTYFDLEDPRTQVLFEEPMTALEPLTRVVVIDGVQRSADLFPILRAGRS